VLAIDCSRVLRGLGGRNFAADAMVRGLVQGGAIPAGRPAMRPASGATSAIYGVLGRRFPPGAWGVRSATLQE
jgi:hypothetical protein